MYYMCILRYGQYASVGFVRAVLIVAFLPVGLGVARTLTDPLAGATPANCARGQVTLTNELR